mmetsp:Transcript_171209/g.548894  ORF Transcript_171209/g.548894 Transcript_171209/m.548894 type:complete len:260 (+) Transcript_171209:508-1287(+)
MSPAQRPVPAWPSPAAAPPSQEQQRPWVAQARRAAACRRSVGARVGLPPGRLATLPRPASPPRWSPPHWWPRRLSAPRSPAALRRSPERAPESAQWPRRRGAPGPAQTTGGPRPRQRRRRDDPRRPTLAAPRRPPPRRPPGTSPPRFLRPPPMRTPARAGAGRGRGWEVAACLLRLRETRPPAPRRLDSARARSRAPPLGLLQTIQRSPRASPAPAPPSQRQRRWRRWHQWRRGRRLRANAGHPESDTPPDGSCVRPTR